MDDDWKQSVALMVGTANADLRNAQILGNPWTRAAHAMVVGWQIRLSQPEPAGRREIHRQTWAHFATRAVKIRRAMASRATADPWRVWAGRRVRQPIRYVPIDDR